MSMPIAALESFIDARFIAETRVRPVADRARRLRTPKLRSAIAGAVLLVLAIAPLVAWPFVFPPTPAAGHAPQHWSYVLTEQDHAPLVYGPFGDLATCDLNLSTATSDLNQRLPGLYIATPCAAAS